LGILKFIKYTFFGGNYNKRNENDRLKFQSKRLQDYGFWETYYFGWRDYDPELGRWFVVDPARQFASPYVAMANNPIIGYDEDGQVAWFVPLLIAGAVNVIIDVGMEYAISQSLNQPFEYSFTDALKSFFQGAALQEFSIASKAGKLGKFAEKLMVKNGIGWSLLRGVTTSFIYSSIDITVDVIDAKLKDKKLGNEYFKNKAIGFGIQSIANGIVDNSIEKLKLSRTKQLMIFLKKVKNL